MLAWVVFPPISYGREIMKKGKNKRPTVCGRMVLEELFITATFPVYLCCNQKHKKSTLAGLAVQEVTVDCIYFYDDFCHVLFMHLILITLGVNTSYAQAIIKDLKSIYLHLLNVIW